jgi:hypothetical protein
MLEKPRSILILQILLILSKNPLLWNFHTWWRIQFMKTTVQAHQESELDQFSRKRTSTTGSREIDVGKAEIHLNPANLVNPVKKSVVRGENAGSMRGTGCPQNLAFLHRNFFNIDLYKLLEY